jgi:protein TonB
MATPFDLRFLSPNATDASAPRAPDPSAPAEIVTPDYALSRRGATRHPVGLLVVVGLHVLLAAAMLTARLNAGPPKALQVALTKIDVAPPPPPPKPLVLPDAPKTLLRQLVAPVPPVVVDHPDAIQAAAPMAPPASPGPATPAVATDSDAGSSLLRVPARPTRISAGDPSCRPVYPHIAEREGVSGTTKLRFTVDPAGHVSAQLLETSGPLRENRRMDQAAIDALSHCPVTVGTDEMGRPVGGTVDVNYKWTIAGY